MASYRTLEAFLAGTSRGTTFPPDALVAVGLPMRPGSLPGRMDGTPGIVKSSSGTGGGTGAPRFGSLDSSSSREGKCAHTMVQTKAKPIVEATSAVIFPDGSACFTGFILTRIEQVAEKITESRVF